MSSITEQANIAARTAAPPLDGPPIEAARAFVERARTLSHVQQILIEESRVPARIWTIIFAPPFEDSYRVPVYEAEMAIHQQEAYPLVEFRLINMQEIEQELTNVLPASHRILFERD